MKCQRKYNPGAIVPQSFSRALNSYWCVYGKLRVFLHDKGWEATGNTNVQLWSDDYFSQNYAKVPKVFKNLGCYTLEVD